MKYNNENRKLYPTYIGHIVMKNGQDLVCDPDLCESLTNSLNTKGFIWSELYQKTIHAFDIEYIEKVKTTDHHRKLIHNLVIARQKLSEPQTLSFNDSLLGLKAQNNGLTMIEKK